MLKSFIGQSEHTLPCILQAIGENFSPPSTHPTSQKFIAMCDEILIELQVKKILVVNLEN